MLPVCGDTGPGVMGCYKGKHGSACLVVELLPWVAKWKGNISAVVALL